MWWIGSLTAAAVVLAGCAGSGADQLASTAGFTPTVYDGGAFRLRAWERGVGRSGDVLRVYIEGDGRAYISRTRPSADPTPSDPLALRLAAADPFPKVLALARPCQYAAGDPGCTVQVWTTGRFSPAVIAATGRALDAAKVRFQVTRLELVGYSGGAAVAVLVAAGREDVAAVITVAGMLDARMWTALHKVTPLTGSLDPLAAAPSLARVAQTHLVGTEDAVVPPAVTASFAAQSGGRGVAEIPGATHHCCWVEAWPALLAAHPPR